MKRRRRGSIPPWLRRWSSLVSVVLLAMACCVSATGISSNGQQTQLSIHLFQRTAWLRREHHQASSHPPPSAIVPLTELVAHHHSIDNPIHFNHDPSPSSSASYASDESTEKNSNPHVRRPRHKLGTEIGIHKNTLQSNWF